MDLTVETIVRRDTHLLPSGIRSNVVPFAELRSVSGQNAKNNYVLSVTMTNGRQIEIGRVAALAEMTSLAQAIADKSGARLDLR